ncbi:MAG: TetR/AcrR family transcriptional regulator [Chloroflexi bacterium]|nr:TetR/AcrR family transcriptional regulator [Chloroflexota bacterium]
MQQRSLATRTKLLNAALKCFASDGYNAATVDAICAGAGVSKGAFYHHFPSKHDIFLALLHGWLKTVDGGLDASRQDTVPETLRRMTSLLPTIFAAADNHILMFLEFWLRANRDEEIWSATIAPYRRYTDYFADLVEQGIAEGSFNPVNAQVVARMIMSMTIGFLLQGLMEVQEPDWGNVAQEGIQLFIDGLLKDGS